MQEKNADVANPVRVSTSHRHFPRADIEQSIYDRFAQQVAIYGNRPAIHGPNHRWSYEDLSRHVDEMAQTVLSRCGREPGRLALLFEHDAPMCAGVLAALRAGKTYVPLDPGYPVDRLRTTVEDCRPQAILAERRCFDLAQDLAGSAWPVVAAEESAGTTVPFPTVAPRDAAYILYTSGSTGQPKGVVQNQRNVLHFIRAYSNNLELAAEDRMTLLSSYSFDAAVMGMYGALLNGACLCPRSVRDVGFAGIGTWLRDFDISVYHSTPTVFRHFLLECAEVECFPKVRRVVLGGEAVVPRDVDLFKRHFVPGTVMVNGLGPTESTVTLQYFVDHDTKVPGHTVPVGRPVCDTEIVLVDENGQEGQSEGELVFVSEHVALGYFEKPALTAKAFGERQDSPGKRYYRSGDLARYLDDGTLEFLGRRDLQVKVHGVRIELGEVEAAVERFPGVTACVAVALSGPDRETQIAAAIRVREGVKVDLGALRLALQETLVPAMVPSHLTLLEEFPLTPTAKVDRLALKEVVELARCAEVPRQGLEPQTPIEEALCDVWQTVLGRQPAALDEDFFEVGGDSLSAVRLRDQLLRKFQREWSLGRIFEVRTFGRFARVIEEQGETARSDASLVRLTDHRTLGGAHLFCICGVELYRPLARAIGAPHNVSGVFLPIEEHVFEGKAMPELPVLAAMYGEVVRQHQDQGPYFLAGVSFGGILAYELARQFVAAGERVAFLGVFDSTLPQTIGRWRRLRAHALLAARQGAPYVLERMHRRAVKAKKLILGGQGHSDKSGDDSVDPERMMRTRERVYDFALESYRRNMPHFDGELHFFRAADRPDFERLAFPLDCNWSRFVRGRCHTYEVPGGHVSMLDSANVRNLGALVRTALEAGLSKNVGR